MQGHTHQRLACTARLTGGCLAAALCAEATAEEAGFIEGAKATLQARNYFFSRDYADIKGSSTQSRTQEWAQGFILNASSGYTQGTLGVGIDVTGLLGFKLDSSPEHACCPALKAASRPTTTAAWARRSSSSYRRPSSKSAS